VRPLKNGNFCSSSRKAKISTTGIYGIFRGLKFEPDAEIGKKVPFCKGLTLMEDMEMSKVTAKYQITIPPEVRNKLGIVPGSEVEITRKGSRYILVANPIEELKKKWRGKFKNIQKTDDYITDIRGEVN